jgi:hypothetical protein
MDGHIVDQRQADGGSRNAFAGENRLCNLTQLPPIERYHRLKIRDSYAEHRWVFYAAAATGWPSTSRARSR